MHDPSVKMVERIAAVLRLLSSTDDRGVPLADICETLELKKTTAHRILAALVESGLLFQDVVTRNYRLGFAAAAMGRSAFEQDIAGIARPFLLRLASESGDTAFASALEGSAAICVAREVGEFPIRTLTLSVGDRRPLGVGAGSLALLAALPDAVVARTLQRNQGWLRDFQGFEPATLHKLVADTRQRGFALNEGRIVPGMNAVAVAVLDEAGEPLAALSLAAIRDRMEAGRIEQLAGLLRGEAALMAGQLARPRLAAE
jgi:DNA-binding IclR family transcriptional regulator